MLFIRISAEQHEAVFFANHRPAGARAAQVSAGLRLRALRIGRHRPNRIHKGPVNEGQGEFDQQIAHGQRDGRGKPAGE